jgi:ribosomal protein L37AE/L43A
MKICKLIHLHTDISLNKYHVKTRCPCCGKQTVFVTGKGFKCDYLHVDDIVYCETCGLEKTGKAFVNMTSVIL